MKALTTALGALMTLAVVGCTVHSTEPPPLSGPSGLAQQVTIRATPDRINQDGASQSAVEVTVIGPNGQPQSGVAIRMDMLVNGQLVDFGTLSARTIVTGTDGKARVTYTAPPAAPPTNQVANTVSIRAATLGTDAAASNPETVDIRLMPTGVILPPAGTPTPCFNSSPTAPTANTTVQFTAGTSVNGACGAASSDIVTFSWTFGDGSSGAGRTVSHSFAAANSYNVSLTETNDRGVSATVTQALSIGSATLPTPVIDVSPTAPGVNETVFFNASRSTAGTGHTIVSYRWDFGDGGTATGITASHRYTATGAYTAVLTATDEAGQTASTTAQVPVGTATPGPTAAFNFSPQAPTPNQAVTFDASTSLTQQGQTLVDYAWSFGDGTTITHTTAKVTSHTYTRPGTFVANLVVTDSAGRTASTSSQVTVGAAAGPTAAFNFSPTAPTANQSVTFDASTSTSAQGVSITDYAFSFGDGTPVVHSTQRVVGHTFGFAGTFSVNLVVTDSLGRTGSFSSQIIVAANAGCTQGPEQPCAAFTVTPQPARVGQEVSFDGTASQGSISGATTATIVSYIWDFGDGSPQFSAPNVGYTYRTAGTYSAKLTVTDNRGKTASTTRTVVVQP